MKFNVTILVLMILFKSYSLTAQTKENYLLKSKHQRTAAWFLLGGGVLAGSAGGLLALHGIVDLFDPKPSNNLHAGAGLMFVGTGAIIGSIPMFISASKNRRRAMSISFTNQPLPELVKNMVGNKYIPSINLCLKL
ncbi:MAG: hypothetical protein ABI185_00520 [Ginsengibacter sp.]